MSRLAHLVPPKIASPSAIGAPQSAARMTRVVDFYSKVGSACIRWRGAEGAFRFCPVVVDARRWLPKGSAPKRSSSGPISWYRKKYFEGENASGAPFIHAIGALFIVGYSIAYNMHLKHHKNNHH
ncbi:BQ5605_C018g08619 [Microbotryum silenes-dioicae]|uniref:BQ5605_C018g08619 protein n=1 Tax=Microbotryum silenes-dioicae TaxID=796604 RepID=A0A2X0M0I8_9BASI|nr:BQ5605_C018g08619 [Microbotryum silenes-dioicae]